MQTYAAEPAGAARRDPRVGGPARRSLALLAVLSLIGAVSAPLVPAMAEATVVPPRVGSPVVGPVPLGPLTVPAGVAGKATRAEPAPADGFRWPLDDAPQVVRQFDPPPQPWLPGHRGVDLAAAPGAVVRSAGAGVVHFAGRIADRGVVSVSHLGGLRTTYEPVEPLVAAGDLVGAGDPIGLLVAGHPGCSAPACLHWGLRRGEEYLDPLSLLGLGRVRLLPARARRSVRRSALGQARGWA